MSFPTLTASNDDGKAEITRKLRAAGYEHFAELDTLKLAKHFHLADADYKSEGDILEEIEAILGDLILQQREKAIPIEKLLENIDRKITTPAPGVEDPAIISHGHLSYSIGNAKPIVVTVEEDAILQAFAKHNTAMTTKQLEKLVANVARVIGRLEKKFSAVVHRPERKGDGYFIAVTVK